MKSDHYFIQKNYPSGSSPGRFYGTAKLHKLKEMELYKIYHLDQIFQILGQLRTNQQKI